MVKLAAGLVCQSQFSYKAVAQVGKKSNETKSLMDFVSFLDFIM